MDAIEVLQVLGQEYAVEILQATKDPRTAPELSDDLGIPIATTYRRLDALTDADLVCAVAGSEADSNGAPTAFQRTVDDLRVEFESGTIDVTVPDEHTVFPHLRDLWQGLTQ